MSKNYRSPFSKVQRPKASTHRSRERELGQEIGKAMLLIVGSFLAYNWNREPQRVVDSLENIEDTDAEIISTKIKNDE